MDARDWETDSCRTAEFVVQDQMTAVRARN